MRGKCAFCTDHLVTIWFGAEETQLRAWVIKAVAGDAREGVQFTRNAAGLDDELLVALAKVILPCAVNQNADSGIAHGIPLQALRAVGRASTTSSSGSAERSFFNEFRQNGRVEKINLASWCIFMQFEAAWALASLHKLCSSFACDDVATGERNRRMPSVVLRELHVLHGTFSFVWQYGGHGKAGRVGLSLVLKSQKDPG